MTCKDAKYYLLSLVLTAFNAVLWGQRVFEGISVKAGFSTFAPDDRLFPFAPWLEEFFASASYSNDREFCILIEKSTRPKSRFEGSAGIGYSFRRSNFPTLVNQYYFGIFSQPVYVVDEYRRQFFVFPLSLKYHFLYREHSKASFGISALNSFVFNKKIESASPRFSKKGIFDLNNVDLNAGVGYEYKRLLISVNYRLIAYNRPDRAILSIYNFPLRSPGTPADEAPYDFFNPTKIWFMLGYKFSAPKN
jgi:hypothetical protein